MKTILRLGFCILALLCLQVLHSQTIYTSKGTWTVPTGIKFIKVKVYGGAGGYGGKDCGAGCGNAAPGPVGYMEAVYPVAEGDIIGIYPGGKGINGSDNVTGIGGGPGGVSSYSADYNGGTGGNTGNSGFSGAGGGGGAASILTKNSSIIIIAGGAGAGGGMGNFANSGKPGNAETNANGTSTNGGDGASAPADGGAGGGGGAGYIGSLGGDVYIGQGEYAGNGGYRGSNFLEGTGFSILNGTKTWLEPGSIEITGFTNGFANGNQTICKGSNADSIKLYYFTGTIQWQRSTNNQDWTDITGATEDYLSPEKIGILETPEYFRAVINGTEPSNTVSINFYEEPTAPTSIIAENTVCEGSPNTLIATGGSIGSGANYIWGTGEPGENIIADQTTYRISILQTQGVKYWVKRISSFGCGQATEAATITIKTGIVSENPSGSGTTSDPYLISNIFHLKWISENSSRWDKSYRQTNNINAELSVYECNQGYQGLISIGNDYSPFIGSYDGGFYKITNAIFVNPTSQSSGIFGLNKGTIKNLIVENIVLKKTSTYSGGIVGVNQGTISQCKVNATLILSANTGLIAGYNSGKIEKCISMGRIRGNNYSGGIVAVNFGSISNCYSKATIESFIYSGGIAGRSYGKVSNCYFNGSLMYSSSPYVLIAIGDYSQLLNSFFNKDLVYSENINGKTSLELRTLGTFFNSSWDIQCEIKNGTEDIWAFNPMINNGMPFLTWEGYTGVCPEWKGVSNKMFGESDNWKNNLIPEQEMDIIIADDASDDLELPQNWKAGNIIFKGANKSIALGEYDLTITGEVRNANALNFIRSNGSGKIKRFIRVNESFEFPMGYVEYSPVTITNKTGNPDDFTVNVTKDVLVNGTTGNAIPEARVGRTWHIGKTNPNNEGGIDLTFNWNNDMIYGSLSSPALYHFDNTWQKQEGNFIVNGNSLTFQGYKGSFSPFAIVENSFTLPVSGLKFEAVRSGDKALLSWSTKLEYNSSHFIIQHSTNGITWNDLSKQVSKGNSNVKTSYSYLHTDPSNGKNYYRLVQVDKDGRSTITNIQIVNFNNNVQIMVYPNPAIDFLKIKNINQYSSYEIFNVQGALLKKGILNQTTETIDLKEFKNGLYQVKIVSSQQQKTIPFIIAR